jgi:hypothetical protein
VASVGNQGCSINWETSCELIDAKPVIYTISFIVIGPKEVLDKF